MLMKSVNWWNVRRSSWVETGRLEDNWVEKLEMEGRDCVGRAGAHSYFPPQNSIPSLPSSLTRSLALSDAVLGE